MAGNFAKPVTTDLYTDILTLIRENQTELAKMLDGSTAISIPSGAKRWNETNKRFEKYNGTAWSALMYEATASASGLMSAADKVQVDALGTASSKNNQVGAYDATPGYLMQVGAFGGFGSAAPSGLSAARALDLITETSVYVVSGANVATVGAPAGAGAGTVLTIRYNSTYACQHYINVNAGVNHWIRQLNNTVWSAWVKLLHTENLLNTDIPEDATHRWTTDAEKTAWNAKASGTHTHVMNDLSNVIQSSAAAGELLKFNGTNWVNNTLAEAGIAAATHTHLYAGAASAGGAATSASKLATARTISLTGDVTGSASFDGSAAVSIAATVANDSHTHSTYAASSHSHAYLDTDIGYSAVGSLCFAYNNSSSTISPGGTIAGSSLKPIGIASSGSSSGYGTGLTGTWRCLGYSQFQSSDNIHTSTLWQRIS